MYSAVHVFSSKISNSIISAYVDLVAIAYDFAKNRPYVPTANNSAPRLPNQDEWVPILRLTKSILDHWTVDNLAGAAIGVAFVWYVRNGFFFCQVVLAKSGNLIPKKLHSSHLNLQDFFHSKIDLVNRRIGTHSSWLSNHGSELLVVGT